MSWEFVKSDHYGFFCLVDQNGNDILIPDGQNDGDYPVCWMGEDMSDHVKRLIEVSPDLLAVCQHVERELCEITGNLRIDGYRSLANEIEALRTDIHDVISQIPEVTDE